LIKELADCGMIHTTLESAVSHIQFVYHNVQEWWEDQTVQDTVSKLKTACYPESQVVDYLLSLTD
jgi:hypothetical protein